MTIGPGLTPGWSKNRWVGLGAIALIAILVLTFVMAPTAKQTSGSTYSRAPDGYGAWYAYMQQQGTPIQRWKRPYPELERLKATPGSMTLLRVTSGILSFLDLDERQSDWVKQGNRLVVLGVPAPVTHANFKSVHASPFGDVEILTRRRLNQANGMFDRGKMLLGDRFGPIIWSKPVGKGEIIYATAADLAANAYQDAPGNFKFLAQIVTDGNHAVWVDEYIHGYKESDVIAKEAGQSWTAYLAKTPLLPILVQVAIVLALYIGFSNRRFGAPVQISAPVVDNSTAYIEALAGILQKAESSEFILDVVGKEEQLHLQKWLGLGTILLEPDPLLQAWTQQTGRSPRELETVLQPYWQKRRLNEADLKTWIASIQTLRQQLSS
ncbi:MAG TPA: DUF4350 domain-containing protein [Crinalium sp.]|jgi:hypothetical protein